MRRNVATLFLLLALGAALFAAGDQEVSPGEKPTILVNVRDTHPPAAGMGTIADNLWTQWINENAPVNVEFLAVHPRDTVERFNILFASGEAPDLILHPWQNRMNPWADQGLLLPLDDLIPQTENIRRMFEEHPEYLPRARAADGRIYFLGNAMPTFPNWMLFYRKDWLDNLGLSVPQTVEEFLEVARAFTYDDPDGNGVDDTYGYSLAYAGGFYVNAMFGATDTDFYIEDDDLVHDLTRRYEATSFKKVLFDEGVVSPDFLADGSGQNARQDFLTGRTGIFAEGWGNLLADDLLATFFENNPDGVIDVMPSPRSRFGRFSAAVDMPVQQRYAVNADTEYPEATMAYADWLADPETIVMLRWGVEGRHHFINDLGGAVRVTEEQDPVAFREVLVLDNFYTWFAEQTYGAPAAYWDRSLTVDLDNPYAVLRNELFQKGTELYISPDSPFTQQIMSTPSFPTELDLIANSMQSTLDMWNRAIVSGDNYTPEDALADAQELWDTAGGPQLEEFYSEWFRANRNRLLITSEWY